MNNIERLDAAIDSALEELKIKYGNVRDDYYGLAFLEHVLQLPRKISLTQNTFGNHDLGIDGYHFDREQEIFRVFQFKNSKSPKLFAPSMMQLLNRGLRNLFEDYGQRPVHQPIVDGARQALLNNKDEISQIYIDFVFRGDPGEAQQSVALTDLRTKLEEMNWLTETFFKDRVPITVRFLSFDGVQPDAKIPAKFSVRISSYTKLDGPEGLQMFVGFVPLVDLHAISSVLQRTFLESNIRFALPPDGAVNRSLSRTFSEIVLERTKDPKEFAFHHNGITLSAAMVEPNEDGLILSRPRLLNGAQTVSTFSDFWDRNMHAFRSVDAEKTLQQICVLCRVVAASSHEMITRITISNNRQNPVQAWQLHANDQIQLRLEDWFKEDGIPYQRQHRAFYKLSAEEWQEKGYTETRAVELIRLARTYLAVEGDLTKLSHISEEFENETNYERLFGEHRLDCDRRKVIACYKAGFKINTFVKAIKDKGEKYEFISRGRDLIYGLVCQAMLNHEDVEDFLDQHGRNLTVSPDFTDKLFHLASSKVRFLLRDVSQAKEFAKQVAEEKYTFLKTTPAFDKAMKLALNYGWKRQLLCGAMQEGAQRRNKRSRTASASLASTI